MLNVATIVGTRPELIRLCRIISKLDQYCNHTLIHTGQNYDYELNGVFFDDLEIRKPDFFLDSAASTPLQTIANIISSCEKVFQEIRPDALLILGDTNSCLCAIVAKRYKVPIFHMEAGNRCFDQTVPEEINRKIVDHISDINLTYSSIARDYLIGEGFPPDQVIKTGSPLREVVDYYSDKINNSQILSTLGLAENNYFLFSSHREELVDSPSSLKTLLHILNSLAEDYGLPIVFSTHPRTRNRLNSLLGETPVNPLINFSRPFGYSDYVKLQLSARAVLSDSGTITEESSILNFPALNLRRVHERPEGFEEASVMMVGLNYERIRQCLSILDSQVRGSSRKLSIVSDYMPVNVSEKVLRIIHSYVDFVDSRVWHKPS